MENSLRLTRCLLTSGSQVRALFLGTKKPREDGAFCYLRRGRTLSGVLKHLFPNGVGTHWGPTKFSAAHFVARVQEHSGAIVKTIGDAVMAVFSRPTDALSAALHILQEIERYNLEHGEPGIILKIGAHCGPSIAVTLNENLDYFGQTVNVAARVQSLADAGEICISEALYTAPGIGDLLTRHRVIEFASPLRGVEGNASVYRIVRGQ